MAGNTVKFKATLDDKVSSNLNKIRDSFDRLGGKGSAASLFGNVGAKAIAKGFGLIDRAAAAVVDVLGDSVRAALAEEKSIAGLDAALRANVKGWDGNRDAIEKVLKVRMRLGFSDDEQRESLKLLVAATGDSAKALAIQRTAMDLARLKSISLADASTALVRVEGGQFRALKALGIQLPKNATATEALAAVQRVANGQAEAFAKTSAGKMEAATKNLGEVMEKLGAVILPIVTNAMVGVAEAAQAVDDFFGTLSSATNEVHDDFADFFAPLSEAREGLEDLAGTSRRLPPTMSAAGAGAHTFSTEIAKIGDAADRVATRVNVSLDSIVSAFKTRKGEMETAASDAADAVFGRLEARAELNRLKLEEGTGKLTRAQLGVIATLAAHGAASQKELNDTIVLLVRKLKTATDAEAAAITILIAKLSRANQIAENLRENVGAAGDRGGGGRRPPRRAAGGPVSAGAGYMVGERGPEWFSPRRSGTIIPNNKLGGGGVTINFNSAFPVSPSQAQQVAALIVPAITREQRRQGIL